MKTKAKRPITLRKKNKLINIITREPLFVFLILGFLGFIFIRAINPDSLKSEQPFLVNVSEKNLISFIQAQNKVYKEKSAKAYFKALSEDEKEEIKKRYIHQEVLYREGLKLGLDENDEMIKRRLVQKMEYLTRGFSQDIEAINETEIKKYYQDNIYLYIQEQTVSFSHIYFSKNKRGLKNALFDAQNTKLKVREEALYPEQAGKYGDHFLYFRSYINKSEKFVASQLGDDFSKDIFSENKIGLWVGPFKSTYGYHLVYIIKNTAEITPPIEDVASLILADLQQLKVKDVERRAINKIIEKYEIVE
ncbi:peptidyl-prolyl cis-trans isomerase [Colwellia demingiae]|uniref:Peptidyl-prolyl cis-trans isomerase n=1 Tax=Colwellia demingiae TaxID=89401 RepID=A0A5C6QGY1_9GAMM|nr:peptidylprolyl isomerase [Colwellia demingiae]TWX68061.1 peptidyl-prolyl cis-trans isomerase [Colwellia demingiae]